MTKRDWYAPEQPRTAGHETPRHFEHRPAVLLALNHAASGNSATAPSPSNNAESELPPASSGRCALRGKPLHERLIRRSTRPSGPLGAEHPGVDRHLGLSAIKPAHRPECRCDRLYSSPPPHDPARGVETYDRHPQCAHLAPPLRPSRHLGPQHAVTAPRRRNRLRDNGSAGGAYWQGRLLEPAE